MGFVSRHARTGGEEKKRGAGRSFDRSDSTHLLTQLWLLMLSRKIEDYKTSVCHGIIMLFYY